MGSHPVPGGTEWRYYKSLQYTKEKANSIKGVKKMISMRRFLGKTGLFFTITITVLRNYNIQYPDEIIH